MYQLYKDIADDTGYILCYFNPATSKQEFVCMNSEDYTWEKPFRTRAESYLVLKRDFKSMGHFPTKRAAIRHIKITELLEL